MRFKDDWVSIGQNGTLQGQYLSAGANLPQRDPLTVMGRVRVAAPGPQGMQAFAGIGNAEQKEWSFFGVPGVVTPNGGVTVELSLEVQLASGLSRGLGGANKYDSHGWHTVALVRSGQSFSLYVDSDPPRGSSFDAAAPLDGSLLTLGYTPGMFGGALKARVDLRDWRVWEAALWPDEVAWEMSMSGPLREAGLWAWWPLDRYGLEDRSGNEHDLAVVADSGTATLT